MIRTLSLIILLLSLVNANSFYSQQWDWSKSAGGLTSDKGTSITVDLQGNIYTTGYFNESGSFGPFIADMVDLHSKEVFVTKQDPSGTFLWMVRGTNHYDDRGLGICLDAMGNVFVTGTCWGEITFNGVTATGSTNYSDQIFVLKLDNAGNVVWLKNAGFSSYDSFPYQDDHGYDVCADQLGNIFVTGFLSNKTAFTQVAEFDALTIPLAPDDSVAFIAKLDNSGAWQWVQTFNGEESYREHRLTVDNENSVYITGGFDSNRTFGTTTLVSAGGFDIYVVKYNQAGVFQWANRAGSDRDDRGNDIAFDGSNHLYVTGEFRHKAGFGLDSLNNNGSAGGRDMFVAKISKTGDWVWAKKGGSSSGSDRGNGVVVNSKGLILLTGTFKDTAKFGSNVVLNSISTVDSVQVYVAAINADGKWQWALAAGGTEFDSGAAICADTSCNAFITGYYSGTISFGASSLTSVGKKDIFITKIKDACEGAAPPTPTIPVEIIEIYTMNGSNIFTPNNDGVNDQFELYKNSNAKMDFVILNRWGNVVFKTNDPTQFWNGKDITNNAVVDGTYFYNLKFSLKSGETKSYNGFVQVSH
jgi:gliding motility-associated-like protein